MVKLDVAAVDRGFWRPEQATIKVPGIVNPLLEKTSLISTEGGTVVRV